MASKEISFTPNAQMRAAIERQAQIDHRTKASLVKRAARGYLSRLGWNSDYLDGIPDAEPLKDGSEAFPANWNGRGKWNDISDHMKRR